MAILNIVEIDSLILSNINTTDFIRLLAVNKYTYHVITNLPIYPELCIAKNLSNINYYYKNGWINILQNHYNNNRVFFTDWSIIVAFKHNHMDILNWLFDIGKLQITKMPIRNMHDYNQWLKNKLHCADILCTNESIMIDIIINSKGVPKYTILRQKIKDFIDSYKELNIIDDESNATIKLVMCIKDHRIIITPTQLLIYQPYKGIPIYERVDDRLHHSWPMTRSTTINSDIRGICVCDMCGLCTFYYINCGLCKNNTNMSIFELPRTLTMFIEELQLMNIICYIRQSIIIT